MSEILVFAVFHMACLASDGETLRRVPDKCSILRAVLHPHYIRTWQDACSLHGPPKNTKPWYSPFLASVCDTRCYSSQASWVQAHALWQPHTPNHNLDLCNDSCNRVSLHSHQACISRAAQTLTELYLIYHKVIRKQIFSASKLQGCTGEALWGRVHQLPEGALSTAVLNVTSVVCFVLFTSLQIIFLKAYKMYC